MIVRFATRLAIVSAALLQGFLSMGFQLVATRVVAPYFGASLIVWAFVISTFLAAFSLGAFLGGLCSQRRSSAACGRSGSSASSVLS